MNMLVAGSKVVPAVLEPDLAQMLRELAATGWKPLLYAEINRFGDAEWVCYPQSAVRHWVSTRAMDPVGAVRELYRHALQHPNRPPDPPAPMPPAAPAAPAVEEGARKPPITVAVHAGPLVDERGEPSALARALAEVGDTVAKLLGRRAETPA